MNSDEKPSSDQTAIKQRLNNDRIATKKKGCRTGVPRCPPPAGFEPATCRIPASAPAAKNGSRGAKNKPLPAM